MIRKPSFRRSATVAAAWLVACAGGCQLPNVSRWHLPEPPVPDVRPILQQRNDDAVRDFEERRNAAQYLAAQTSWRQGDYRRCGESLDKVLERDPNHRGALLLSADVALETDRPQEAVKALRRALAVDPHDAEVAYRLGLALETVDQVAEAVPYLRQAAQADPANAQYADSLAEAESQLRGEKPTNVVLESPPEVPSADDESPAVATTPSAESPSGSTDERDPEFVAALADWEANRLVECADRLSRILARDASHVEANILQAEIDLNGGQTAAALRRMDRLVLRHPRSVQVRQACGLVNEAAGNREKADLFFQEAEALAEADMLVAVAYQEPLADEAAPTEAVADEAAEPSPPEVPQLLNFPDESLPQDAASLLGDGQAALEAGKLTDARRMLKAAVARDKNDPQTAVSASIAALKLEQPELAFELAEAATAAFPRSAPLHRIRGMAAYRLGRYAEAESALRQSLNLDNSQALSYFLLGSAQSRLGRTESAQRNLREAARLDARYAPRR